MGLKLAFIGSIKDEILQTEELAAELVRFLKSEYPGVLEEKYDIRRRMTFTNASGILQRAGTALCAAANWIRRKQRQSFWMISAAAGWGALHLRNQKEGKDR